MVTLNGNLLKNLVDIPNSKIHVKIVFFRYRLVVFHFKKKIIKQNVLTSNYITRLISKMLCCVLA